MIKGIYIKQKNLFKQFFKKKRKRSLKRKKINLRKNINSKKIVIRSKGNSTAKNDYPYYRENYFYASIIIFFGFLILSLTIFLFMKQIQPFLNNERLKFLCTYQIGDKKNKSYKEAKIKLDKLVGNSDEFCKNFIFPSKKNRGVFKFIPIIKNIILRFL